MSDHDRRVGDGTGGRARDPGWLARELAEDPYLMPELHDLREQFPEQPTDQQRLQLRQMLDSGVRRRVRWPAGHDYAQAADDMEAAGWLEHASVLREIAGTDHLQDQALRHWTNRYLARSYTRAEAELDRLAETGDLEFADADEAYGVDGARYQRGYITAAAHAGHVAVVSGRGLSEMVPFGNDEEACQQWLAGRGDTAFGPLSFAGPAGTSRTAMEEQMLIATLRDPDTLIAHLAWCSPDTFTADGRYEIYTALLALCESSKRWYPWQAAGELARRKYRLPADVADRLGSSLPAYLERLIETPVTAEQAAQAAQRIRADDVGARPGSQRADTGPAGLDPDILRWRRLRSPAATSRQPGRAPAASTAPVQDATPPSLPGPSGPVPSM